MRVEDEYATIFQRCTRSDKGKSFEVFPKYFMNCDWNYVGGGDAWNWKRSGKKDDGFSG